MARRATTAALTFLGVALPLFIALICGLYALTFGIERGREYGELGIIILWPVIGILFVLSLAAGLVASHVVYRRAGAA